MLLDLHDTATRLIHDAAAIRVPTLLLAAGSDWVVSRSVQRKFFERLGSPVKHLEVLRGSYHDVYHETDAARPLRLTRQFIEAAFAHSPETAPLLDAHERGYTFDEYRALCRAMTPLSIKWITYKSFGLFLRTLGRLSAGIRLGWESGFNSGRMLDYVYQNRADGFTALGRLIDRQYLNGIGWRGIRVRRRLLEQVVDEAIERAHADKKSVHVVDVAAGAGRYLLDTLKRCESRSVTAELRDMEPANLEEARRLADSLGLRNVSFVAGDAFDLFTLQGLSPRPDIAIVSGLYELFPDNTKVLNSLSGTGPGGTGRRLADLYQSTLASSARTDRARALRLGRQALGRCAGARKPRSTIWYMQRVFKSCEWRSIRGECSRCRSRAASAERGDGARAVAPVYHGCTESPAGSRRCAPTSARGRSGGSNAYRLCPG